ncbi:phage protein GemA/Gp16 family protein [uncultured Desulfuromonas sp.]|uniref:phage protein GemA/Gp16 family protein n=1 Tax=uncultured Desulfuromonas sp. TaxID=181013 RepID=UPI002AABFB2D|nr:phage protein GemA/Gp16 family protein [uncultured Desulfuromonas sp.]
MPQDPMLQKIHIAKKDLALDDDTYRDAILMISNGRTDSSKHLLKREKDDLLKHFESLGWQPKRPKRKPNNMDKKTSGGRRLAKIGAMLAAGKKPWSYADAMAKHMYDVDSVRFLHSRPADLRGIISALQKEGEKKGWDLK